jgi:hypothetical protein
MAKQLKENSNSRYLRVSTLIQLLVISVVITTTLTGPAAVGDARNVEPPEESLEPGEKPANTVIIQSLSRTLSIRPNSF